MKNFTVVVLYPQGVAEDFPHMTYTANVRARDAFAARKVGVLQAWNKQKNEDRGPQSRWLPLVVFEGKIFPVAYGWQV